jgi:hypothetical protein
MPVVVGCVLGLGLWAAIIVGGAVLVAAGDAPTQPKPVPHDQCWRAQFTVKGGASLASLYTTRKECERFLRQMYALHCRALPVEGDVRTQCLAEVAGLSVCSQVSCREWERDDWEDADDAEL